MKYRATKEEEQIMRLADAFLKLDLITSGDHNATMIWFYSYRNENVRKLMTRE